MHWFPSFAESRNVLSAYLTPLGQSCVKSRLVSRLCKNRRCSPRRSSRSVFAHIVAIPVRDIVPGRRETVPGRRRPDTVGWKPCVFSTLLRKWKCQNQPVTGPVLLFFINRSGRFLITRLKSRNGRGLISKLSVQSPLRRLEFAERIYFAAPNLSMPT